MSKYVEEFWKEVKPEDFLKNRDMIVRLRTIHKGMVGNGASDWSGPTKLDGFTLYTDKDKVTWYANGSLYDECQMYDPPEYWLNKPTPNPGFRLLNKFPHEDIAIGDEGWNTRSKCWVTVKSPSSNKQPDEVWFSRRIEEPKAPKAKFEVGDPVRVVVTGSLMYQKIGVIKSIKKGVPLPYHVETECKSFSSWFRSDELEPAPIAEGPAVSKSTIFDNVMKQGYRLDARFIHHPKVGDTVVFPSGLRVVVNEKGFTVLHG